MADEIFNGLATDVAGEIVEVGKGVKQFKAGDKVVAILSHAVSADLFKTFQFFFNVNEIYGLLVLRTRIS